MSLWKIDVLIPGIYDFNICQRFLALLITLYLTCIEQENNVDDECTENVCTFLISAFLSTLDKSYTGVSTILVNN